MYLLNDFFIICFKFLLFPKNQNLLLKGSNTVCCCSKGKECNLGTLPLRKPDWSTKANASSSLNRLKAKSHLADDATNDNRSLYSTAAKMSKSSALNF